MAELMLVNPKRRRRRRATPTRRPRRRVARRRNPVTRSRTPIRRRRRNPTPRGIMGDIQNAAVGAAGALAVDVAMAKLPIPINLTATPAMRSATQGAVSLGIGMLVSRFGRKRALGKQLALGGLTVALHGVGKGLIGPTMGLSGMDDQLLGWNDQLLGMDNELAWINPAGAEDFPAYDDLGEMAYESMDDYDDIMDV